MNDVERAPADLVPADQHPAGLYVLFFTEMWERFSYYGMRAILVYYMMRQLLFAQAKASQIYGLYTGLVYFTPLFGGIAADRWLGQRRSVIVGGVLMAIGEFTLMSQPMFYLGLSILIIGNGFFKPNISTQVGNLYAAGDHRRDRAFSIFYVGINVGALLSPFICGTLGERYGYQWGFFAAGIGMIAGLILYLWGQKYLAPDHLMKSSRAAEAAPEPLSAEDWKKIGALVVLCILNIVFWATYEQQGNTLALWVQDNTDRTFHFFSRAWRMPASWFQSFNPAFIFLFTPAITSFWAWQQSRGKEPSSVAKMAVGCILLGLSFLILIPSARAVASGRQAGLTPLVLCSVVITVGELYLSPVGLSLVTKLAPPRMVSMLMGMWFLSSAFGDYLCGYIGAFWTRMPHESFFLLLSALACGTGLGMFALLKPLKRAIAHGREEPVDV